MRKPKSAIPIGNERSRRIQDIGGEEIDPDELSHIQLVKLVYGRERSRWETIKAGKLVHYTFPSIYDGRDAKTIDGDVEIEKRIPSEWVKLTKWIDEHALPVKAFLATIFDHWPCTEHRALEPAQIRNEIYAKLWYDAEERMADRVKISLKIQRDIASSEYTYQRIGSRPYDAWAIVLFNLSIALSPLFRYCIAKAFNTKRFDRIAEIFFADAIMQFERYRLFYKRFWRGLLPIGFSKQSLELYSHLLCN